MMNNSTSPNANHRTLQSTRVVPQNAILQRSNGGNNTNRQAQSNLQSRNNPRLNSNNNSQVTTTGMTSARVQSNSNSVSNLPKSTTTSSNQNSGQKSTFHHDSYLLNANNSPSNQILRNSSLPGLPSINPDPDTSKQPLHILTETSEGTNATLHTPSPASHTISTTVTKQVPSFTSGLSSPKEQPSNNQLSRLFGNKNNNENNKPEVKSPPPQSSFKGINNQFAGSNSKQPSGNFNKMPQGKPFSNFAKPNTGNPQNNNNKAGVLNVNRNIQPRPQNFSISSPKPNGVLTPKNGYTTASTGNAAGTPTNSGYNIAIQSYLASLGNSNPQFLQALSQNPLYAQMLNMNNSTNSLSGNQDQSTAPGGTSVNKSTLDTNQLSTSGDQPTLNLPNTDPTFITKKLALHIPNDINDEHHEKHNEDSPRVPGTNIVKFDLSQKKSLHAHQNSNQKIRVQPLNVSTTPLKYEFDDAHKDWVYAIVLTSDGKQIISASWDKTIKFWDIKLLKWNHSIGNAHNGYIYAMVITHDNRCLITGSSDKSIKIWSVDDKKPLFEIKHAHDESVRVLLLDNKNKSLISGSDDRCIKVWETVNWTNRYTINQAHMKTINALAVTSDDKYILSGSWDKTIKLWDPVNSKCLKIFEKAHEGAVNSIAITSTDRYMFSAGSDLNIKIWDMHLKTCVFTFEKAHSRKTNLSSPDPLENIRRLVISKNDEWVITCSDDRSVKVWDVEERCNTYSYENCHQGGIYGLTMTGDNRYIISGGADGSVKIWNSDMATQKMERIDVAHSKNNPLKTLSAMHDKQNELENKINDYETTIGKLQDELDQGEDEKEQLRKESETWKIKYRKLERDLDTVKKTLESLVQATKQVMPAPGSDSLSFSTKRIMIPGLCLYHCIAFALEPDIRKDLNEKQENVKRIPQAFKKLVIHNLYKDQSWRYKFKDYEEANIEDIIKKIEDENYQGTELDIWAFSRNYHCEIFIIKVTNKIETQLVAAGYGYSRRLYLVFEGSNPKIEHYELIIAKNFKSLEVLQYTVFGSADELAELQAVNIIREYRKF